MKTKKLGFMNVKEDVLSRDEMKNILAGSGGPCRIAVRNSDDSFAYYSECTSVGSAQNAYNFYGSGNPYAGGYYASGYCCSSCGSGSFSNATSC